MKWFFIEAKRLLSKVAIRRSGRQSRSEIRSSRYEAGKCVCMVGGMGKGKRCVQDMTHAAFKAYVKQLSGNGHGKYHNNGGFLKINAKRALAAKQQAHDNKGSAATHS